MLPKWNQYKQKIKSWAELDSSIEMLMVENVRPSFIAKMPVIRLRKGKQRPANCRAILQ